MSQALGGRYHVSLRLFTKHYGPKLFTEINHLVATSMVATAIGTAVDQPALTLPGIRSARANLEPYSHMKLHRQPHHTTQRAQLLEERRRLYLPSCIRTYHIPPTYARYILLLRNGGPDVGNAVVYFDAGA